MWGLVHGRVAGVGTAVGLVIALASCARAAAARDQLSDTCTRAARADRWALAAGVCTLAWRASGDAASGNRAVVATWHRRDDAGALALIDALRDAPADGDRLAIEADLAERAGRPRDAERAYRAALAAYRAAGAHTDVAVTASSLFSLARAESRYGDALEHAQTLLDEATPLPARFRITGLMQAATVLIDIGDLRDAELVLAQARALTTPDMTDLLAVLDTDDGLVHKRGGRLDVAASYYASALRRIDARTGTRSAWEIRVNMTSLAINRGDLAGVRDGLAALAAQLDAAAEPPTPHAAATLLMLRGQAAQAEGRAEEATRTLEAAWAASTLPDQRVEIDAMLGELALARGDRGAALRSWRRALAEIEALKSTMPFDGLVGWLALARERQSRLLLDLLGESGDVDGLVELVEGDQTWAFVRESAPATASAPPLVRALEHTRGLERLTTQLRARAPARRSAAELATRLDGAAVVLFAEGERQLWIVTLANGRWTARAAALAPGRVLALAAQLARDPADERAAAQLGAALLPARVLPAPPAPLVLVPSARLAELPFAALRRAGRFVVEDHALVQVPSLNALVAMRAVPPSGSRTRLWLGDPEGNLPAAAREVAELSAEQGGQAFVGAQASRARLPAEAVALLQLSAHSDVDAEGPYVQLADGRLRAADVLERGLRGNLVVLASCASAGREGSLPWSSLAAAFLAARSGAVLGSLRVVEDDATRAFLRGFYAEGGLTAPVAALARAQRAAIRRGAPVTAWGWFVMYGVGELRQPGLAREE